MSRKRAKTPRPRGRHIAGVPNELELAYAEAFLKPRKLAGEVASYTYEPDKLRLCHRTTFTPDWRVELAGGGVEYHECKGWYMPEDGWIKAKVAAALYPAALFVLARRKRRDHWEVKSIPNFAAGPLSA
jgi:hypothetical protein